MAKNEGNNGNRPSQDAQKPKPERPNVDHLMQLVKEGDNPQNKIERR